MSPLSGFGLSLFAVLFGYLSGSFPTGPLIARRRGVDLRAVGSGNVGATNAARALGKGWGAVVFLGDALKGLLPVLLALFFSPASLAPEAAALGALLGHLLPFTLGFRGGKGVATAFGGFVALSPYAALLSLAAWGGLVLATKKSSVGSLAGALLLPPLVWLLSGRPYAWLAAAVAVVLVIARHKENLSRLWRGKELGVGGPQQ
jgi:glycerol-3-phosphate acyltransferase PlsY